MNSLYNSPVKKKQKLKHIQAKQFAHLHLVHMSNDELRPSAIDKYIGSRLKFARISKNLTLKKIGSMMNCSYQQINKFENGENSLKVNQLIFLSDKLNVSMKWLLKGLSKSDNIFSNIPYDLQKINKGGNNGNNQTN